MNRSTARTPAKAIAALLLYAVFGAAWAQQSYEPPEGTAGAVVIGPDVVTALRDDERARRDDERARREEAREEYAAERAFAERRKRMIDECQDNHGSEIDCERETDTELRAEGLPWHTRVFRGGAFR
jgi:hypothetical protein